MFIGTWMLWKFEDKLQRVGRHKSAEDKGKPSLNQVSEAVHFRQNRFVARVPGCKFEFQPSVLPALAGAHGLSWIMLYTWMPFL